MADQPRTNFNPGIHGARGLFCLMVVLYHIWNSGLPRWPTPELLNQTMEAFRYGVELFFAISGYVIFITMRPVLAGTKTPLDFILNRATRIFPVLWVTILVFLPMGIFKGEGRITEQLTPLWSFGLTLIGNLLALGPVFPVPVLYGVAWTISYEFTFYALCFTYLAGRFYLKRDLRLPVILIGLALIALHPRALFFLSGILVAQGAFDQGPLRRRATWPLLWLAVFLTAWHILSADQSPFFPAMTAWTISHHWPLGLTAFASLTLCIAAIARGQGAFCRLLTTPLLHWLGTISYSLYLWHLIILGMTKFAMAKLGLTAWAGGGAQIVLLLIALPASLLIAHFSQLWLEQRFTTWLRQPRPLPALRPYAAPPFAHKQRP